MPGKHCAQNTWIVKPANENQGKGIKILKDLKAIGSFLDGKLLNNFWIIQKYIERPLLYKNRKFDIRVWVTMTANQDLFFYDEGYLRTSSYDYSENLADDKVHLTNNCL